MPGWLITLLIWGGLALAVVNGIALVWALASGAPASTDPGAPESRDVPYLLYAALTAAGAVAAAIGFAYRRRAGRSGAAKAPHRRGR